MPCFRPRFGKYTFPKNVHVYGGRCPSIHLVRFPHDIIPRCWILKDCRMNECGMVREKRRDPPLARQLCGTGNVLKLFEYQGERTLPRPVIP